jgi:hypothetical protein
MISKETLEAVKKANLTDEQLDEAIAHYTELQANLYCHGEKYILVWKDVYQELETLTKYKKVRERIPQ